MIIKHLIKNILLDIGKTILYLTKLRYKIYKKEKNYLIDKNIRWVLNSGNFIVNRDSFLSTISKVQNR